MEEFKAVVTYQVHDFSDIQTWFGDRGLEITRGNLIEWCYDGTYLYILCNDNAPSEIQPDYYEVTSFIFDSIGYEANDFIEYSKSPFANKLP